MSDSAVFSALCLHDLIHPNYVVSDTALGCEGCTAHDSVTILSFLLKWDPADERDVGSKVAEVL